MRDTVFLRTIFFLMACGAPHVSHAASLIGQPCGVPGASDIGTTRMDLDRTGIVGCFLTESGSSNAVWKAGYPIIPTTAQRRFVFTSNQTWVVPEGVTSAALTMAGGGGSGLGWRISSSYISGHSGGYTFAHPIVVTPGETLTIQVGQGGPGFGPVQGGPASPGPPYYIYNPPIGDNGLGGYPGTSSKVTSPTRGVLLECSGGSGASAGGVDTMNGGTLIPGNQNGATFGGGSPPHPSPNRVASGSYVTPNGPGACGPGGYGIGNPGDWSWTMASGTRAGGRTPFGYGSGGNVHISGCHVTFTTAGTCITPTAGRGGVVFIDVLY